MEANNKICMNGLCGASVSSVETVKGWPLQSGEFATLCHKCGSAYEQLIFCDTFHSKDTGWRECTSCSKSLHCGCIASSPFLKLLNSGGVNCINCAKRSDSLLASAIAKPNRCGFTTAYTAGEMQSISVGDQVSCNSCDNTKLIRCVSTQKESNCEQADAIKITDSQIKAKEISLISEEAGSLALSRFSQGTGKLTRNAKMDKYKEKTGGEDMNQALVPTNLSIAISAPSADMSPQPRLNSDERGQCMKTILQQGKSRHLLPKPPKYVITPGFETSSDMASQLRVARPPVEGRTKNQLLPRYWPRITDQELQQISGDSNATIVPLFEKVLSASDAGRIGRLVLPKACAEAYFPPISQPEGLPLRIQDVKGKEWVFQFRFWPNNNSRMYVLEGVTPCIQSMQLQAGDTVTFSRMEPGGKLLMGFRKASTSVLIQDTHLSTLPKGAYLNESFIADITDNLSSMSGYSGLLQSLKGCGSSSISKQGNSKEFIWRINEKLVNKEGDPLILVPERKRSRNIGSKSKRLVFDSQDALELQLSWEEVHDLLRPPPATQPSTVMIEDHEFEEYEEPPVLGKQSIFVISLSGAQEQWAQCDSCLKWRRLPFDFLIPAKWTCQENIWDHSRCSCSSPDELTPSELENLLKSNRDLKRLRTSHQLDPLTESLDVEALGTASIVGGDIMSDSVATSVATTTKHPRHRPGCSCIVCIQPPSGKGKHKPTCTCNVCMTVKRRFKTLMMRKKKRQSEREAEIAQRSQFMWSQPEDLEVDSISRQLTSPSDALVDKRSQSELQLGSQSNNQLQEAVELIKEQLDLNCRPDHEDLNMRSSHVSMTSLLEEAGLPLETYLKQNGLTSLVCEQQGSSGSQMLPQVTGESVVQVQEDFSLPCGTHEQEGDEELSEPGRHGKKDPS